MKKRQKLKEEKKCSTLYKASHIIGMGDIDMKNIKHFMNDGMSYKEPKIAAAREFLGYNLGFSDYVLEEVNITETQLAANDDILYTAFEDLDDIREIRSRVAECGNTDITLRDFIPPQIYERVKYLKCDLC